MNRFFLPLSLLTLIFLSAAFQLGVLIRDSPLLRSFEEIILLQEEFSQQNKELDSASLVVLLSQYQGNIQRIGQTLPFWYRNQWTGYLQSLDRYLVEFLHFQASLEQSGALEGQCRDILSVLEIRMADWDKLVPSNPRSPNLSALYWELKPKALSLLTPPPGRRSPVEISELSETARERLNVFLESVGKMEIWETSQSREQLLYKIKSSGYSLQEYLGKYQQSLQGTQVMRGRMDLAAREALQAQKPAAGEWQASLVFWEICLVLSVLLTLPLLLLFRRYKKSVQ